MGLTPKWKVRTASEQTANTGPSRTQNVESSEPSACQKTKFNVYLYSLSLTSGNPASKKFTENGKAL